MSQTPNLAGKRAGVLAQRATPLELEHHLPMIVAVANQKGGVGQDHHHNQPRCRHGRP